MLGFVFEKVARQGTFFRSLGWNKFNSIVGKDERTEGKQPC